LIGYSLSPFLAFARRVDTRFTDALVLDHVPFYPQNGIRGPLVPTPDASSGLSFVPKLAIFSFSAVALRFLLARARPGLCLSRFRPTLLVASPRPFCVGWFVFFSARQAFVADHWLAALV